MLDCRTPWVLESQDPPDYESPKVSLALSACLMSMELSQGHISAVVSF